MESVEELTQQVDDLQMELNDVRQLFGELDLHVNPALSLRRQVKKVLRDLLADVAAARRERDEYRKAWDELRVDLNCVGLERDGAVAAAQRWMREHERAVEQGQAWKDDAELKAAELKTIHEILREVGK